MMLNEINLQKDERLSEKVVRGGTWLFSLRMTTRLLGFLRTVVLAKLLSPADFGILAVSMIAANALDTLTETGFQAALIQKKDHASSYLDTAWTINVIRGLFLFSVLFFAAPLIARFFNAPDALPIIRVVACSSIISSLKNIGIIYFQKNLEYRKYYTYEVSSTLIDLSVSILLAFLLRSVWALVLGGLAGNLSRCVLSYVLHSYRPHFRLDQTQMHELIDFGKWIMASSVLLFLLSNSADIFIGKFMGMNALGLYQMAGLLAYLPSSEIAYVVSQVTFSAYAKLQHDLHAIRLGYLKTIQVSFLFISLISAEIFVLADDFTRIFLNAKWLPIVPILQILVFSAFFTTVAVISSQILIALGRPKVDTKYNVLRYAIFLMLLYPLYLFTNLKGIAIATLISVLFYSSLILAKIIHIFGRGAREILLRLFLPMVNAAVMGFFIHLMKQTMAPGVLSFLICTISGILLFIVFTIFSSKWARIEDWVILKDIFHMIRR
jgi:O-antigen/teichoic acid export membrane protein